MVPTATRMALRVYFLVFLENQLRIVTVTAEHTFGGIGGLRYGAWRGRHLGLIQTGAIVTAAAAGVSQHADMAYNPGGHERGCPSRILS